jgi:UDP:flavonoid glycosyltransferase YjiC (YdhE family)
MRMLFAFEGGRGHFDPLVPLAQAAEAAGHVVAFACAPQRLPMVEAAGFQAFVAGINVGGTPETAAMEDRYLATPDIDEREALLMREGFAGWYAQHKAADMLPLCETWRPDLIVRDEIDFGSAVAAERLGLPHAVVLNIAAGSLVRHELAAEPLNALRARHGLPPDPEMAMLSRYLVLSPFPPSFRDPAFPLPTTAHSLRPMLPDPMGEQRLPSWATELSGAPTVYFSLGTAFASALREVFEQVIVGLRDLPINLIVTLGGGRLDPDEFGAQPPNVHIERFVLQPLILPLCSLFVSHGGSSSLMGALANGVPLALIPLNADQPRNAARCVALGAGRVIGSREIIAEEVRAGVAAMLADPSYRRGAERVRAEIEALPGTAYGLNLLERLAAEKQPL